MRSNEMDRLDIVEAVVLIEDIFGIEISDADAEHLGMADEIVDWLEFHLSNRRPNEQAAGRFRKLANAHNHPKLAQGLDGTWRPDQITAIVRDILGGKAT